MDKKETNEQKVDLGELHENEKRLILAIREKYRFAEIKIQTRHGLPYRLKIAERFENLSGDTT